MINFTAEIEPVPFKRVEGHGKDKHNPKRYNEFKWVLGLFARRAMAGRAPLTGAIKISVTVYRPIKPSSKNFGDADNHLKSVLDALNGICYEDDRQVVEAHVKIFKGKSRVEVELEERGD